MSGTQGVQRFHTHFFGTGGSAVEDTTEETSESNARSSFESDVQIASVTSLFDTQHPCFASLGLANRPDFIGERLESVLSDGSRIGASDEDGNTDTVGSGAEKIEDLGHPQTIAVTDADLDDLLGRGMEPRLPMLSTTKKRKKDVSRATGRRTSSVDKVQASRDRNREHARNTRIRKKQYVENLKMQVGEMLQDRAREERDALLDSSRLSAARAAQRQMVLNVFFLQVTGDLSVHAWSSILDDNFYCFLPVTPFRSFPPSEVREFHRVIKGVHGMIQDTASISVFIQTICCRSQNPSGRKVKHQFYTSPEDTIMGSNALMCRWMMRTENAIECGAQCEVFCHGMLRARFASDNRLESLELVFDVMSFMQQLQRALGGGEFRGIPNTLEAAMQPSRHARLVCLADKPYNIIYANEVWAALLGHSQEKAVTCTVSILNGHDEAHEGSKLNAFIDGCMDVSPKRAGSAELHVTSGDMRRFKATVQLYPLGTMEGALTHFLLVMEEVPVCASLSQTSGFPMFAPCPIMQS